MKGFKDSTRTHHLKGGDVCGAAKISKVMGDFKRGGEPVKKAMGGSIGTMPVRKGVPVAPSEPMIKGTPIMRDINKPVGKAAVAPAKGTPIMRDITTPPVGKANPLAVRRAEAVANRRANLGVRRNPHAVR